jgi:small-conductance mechanosensitive channel
MLWLNRDVLGNTILRWAIAAGIAAGGTAVARLVQRWLAPRLAARAARTGQLPAVTLASLVEHTHLWFLAALAVSAGALFLDLPRRPARHLELLVPLALVLQVAAWGHRGIGLWIERQFQIQTGQPATGATRAAVLGFILRLVLWSLLLLLALDVLGFNITTLVASLGIGGIAVALAVQNILGDLFASLSITLDQPFVIGDFIQVDQCLGVVQFIGLKTTRIRSLSGEQIIIANGDLLKSRIRNYKKMLERRVVFGFAVSHRTPAERVAAIPGRVRALVEAQAATRFDRAHFFEFTEAGLRIEVVYFVLDPDYNLYMDVQQAINLGLLEALRRDGVSFSFPGRVLMAPDGAALACGAEAGTMGAWPTHPSPPPPPPGS